MASIKERIRDSWNVFTGKIRIDESNNYSTWFYNNRRRSAFATRQNFVTSIYSRISIDCAAIKIVHSRLDQNEKYIETINDGINKAITLSANIDQTGRAFVQDVVMSMLEEGAVAIVPIETESDPNDGSYDIYTLRVGKIKKWYPQNVLVDLLDDRTGQHKDLLLPKAYVAIVSNPLYEIMNEPNSTLQRLLRKISILDSLDEQTGSNKLDLIVQLPYVIKTEARRKEAEKRRKDIEDQLANSAYGVAYTDGTEKITQLNRSVENNLLSQIQYLTSMLYSQLGLSENVFNGTANEAEMLNYYNRTIEPILSAITDEMRRKFLTDTARSQNQSFTIFRDPFRLVPAEKIADIADKFTRAQVFSANEVRALVGYKPVDDPKADELKNPNLNEPAEEMPPTTEDIPPEEQDPNEMYDPNLDG